METLSKVVMQLVQAYGFKQNAVTKDSVRVSMPGGRRRLRQEGVQETVQVRGSIFQQLRGNAIWSMARVPLIAYMGRQAQNKAP